MSSRLILICSTIAVLALAAAWFPWSGSDNDAEHASETADQPDAGQRLRQGRRLFQQGHYQVALQRALEVLDQQPAAELIARANMLAGESAGKLRNYEAAVQHYQAIPNSAPDAATARWAAAEIQAFQGELTDASKLLQLALQLNPKLAAAHHRWIEVGNFTGRRRETLPSLEFLFQTNDVRPEYLLYAGNIAKETCSDKNLRSVLQKQPQDLLANLGLARLAIADAKFVEARKRLQALLDAEPDLVEAHVQLGFALLATNPDELAAWHDNLPQAAEEHPDVWFIRAQWLELQSTLDQQNQKIIHCLGKTILLAPNHQPAHLKMIRALQEAKREPDVERFSHKAEQLQSLAATLELIFADRSYTPNMQRAAELTYALGRLWEASGWCQIALSTDPLLTWPQPLLQEIESRSQQYSNMPLVLPNANLVTQEWLAQFPPPSFSDLNTLPPSDPSLAESSDDSEVSSVISLVDVAQQSGLRFQFDNNSQLAQAGRRMQETSGGGLGVLDFDLDGLPDVFCTQGGDFPNPGHAEHEGDQLFHNHGSDGQRFVKISRAARITEQAFGQGVAIGDVNADGFDDIYVCNIGPNQLWLNAGDGTFIDGRTLLPSEDKAWTSSAAILDIDLDGFPEIYDANYVMGPKVFTQMCDIGGQPRSCSPLLFSPAPDRLLSPDASGSFRELAQPSMLTNSFGLVGFRMPEEEQPRLLVAGDQMTNLLGSFMQLDSSGQWTLDNQALLAGLAYNKSGQAQACMGIAAGDANEDGLLDFYVTNFYEEYNTLYLQQSGYFEDATNTSGTVQSTKPLLAFGTQFCDVQGDGHEDLLVLNGHIDDHTHVGVPESMLPQLFLGLGDGSFQLARPKPENQYLQQPHIGRALAKLDFDGDNRIDFLCGHLDAPVALLHNESVAQGRIVRIELAGTQSERNAFCTTVELIADQYRATKQLTAGSGYQASNQRALYFSLPKEAEEGRVNVHWPSGEHESFPLDVTNDWLFVEGVGHFPR